jgi:transcriptional regulator with XRE-family HTH domain
MELSVAFGSVIRKLRLEKKLTQEQLAFESELRRTFISSIELGQKEASLNTAFKLSKALGIAMCELIRLVEIDLSKK